MSQSNTQQGIIVLESASNLTGMEGRLATITNSAGKARFGLVNAPSPTNAFVIVDGDAIGKTTAALPLSPDRNVRIRLQGTCEPGDVMVTSSTSTGNAGKVRKLPTAAGTYPVIGIAEESGVEDQLVKIRPAALATRTVTE